MDSYLVGRLLSHAIKHPDSLMVILADTQKNAELFAKAALVDAGATFHRSKAIHGAVYTNVAVLPNGAVVLIRSWDGADKLEGMELGAVFATYAPSAEHIQRVECRLRTGDRLYLLI